MTEGSTRRSVPLAVGSIDTVNNRQLRCWDSSILRKIQADRMGGANWRSLRILVVAGPHPTAINAHVEVARRLGNRVALATDGFVALRMAAVQRPDLVLLDEGVAQVDRIQISRHLRFEFQKQNVWIISLTNRLDDEYRNRSSDAGIDLLLDSGLDPDVFETLLMLESMRVNCSEAHDSATPAGEEFVSLNSHDTGDT